MKRLEYKTGVLIHKVYLCYQQHSHLHCLRYCNATRLYLDTFSLLLPSRQNTAYNPNTVMEGYGMFPKGPKIAGARGIMSNDTHK